jgi:hypothetical protein
MEKLPATVCLRTEGRRERLAWADFSRIVAIRHSGSLGEQSAFSLVRVGWELAQQCPELASQLSLIHP